MFSLTSVPSGQAATTAARSVLGHMGLPPAEADALLERFRAHNIALADPGARISAAYVMTRQSPHLLGDPRATRLIEALYSTL